MPQEERTLSRQASLDFSLWHRSQLPEWCYMTDGDFFEQRGKQPDGNLVSICCWETIRINNIAEAPTYHIWPSKLALGLEIEKKMRIPYYVVFHTPALTQFYVFRPSSGERRGPLTESEFINFVKSLPIPIEEK